MMLLIIVLKVLLVLSLVLFAFFFGYALGKFTHRKELGFMDEMEDE